MSIKTSITQQERYDRIVEFYDFTRDYESQEQFIKSYRICPDLKTIREFEVRQMGVTLEDIKNEK